MIHDFATMQKASAVIEPVIKAEQIKMSQPALQRKRVVSSAVGVGIVLLGVAWGGSGRLSQSTDAEASFDPHTVEVAEENEAAFAADQFDLMHSVVEPLDFAKAEEDKAAFEAALHDGMSEESHYGFYDSLPSSPWHVPVQRGIYITEEDRKRASYSYMLQAVSTRSAEQARSIVQKLKKLDMNATYNRTGSGWYQVKIGPFHNVSVMNKAEDQLVAMGMMPLKLRVQ